MSSASRSLLYAAALLLTLAPPALAQVGVLAPEPPPRPDGTPAPPDPAVAAITEALERVGVAHRRIGSAPLTEAALRPFDVVILPPGSLGGPDLAALRQFAARGGRWVAYAVGGPEGLDALLGIRPVASPVGPAPTALLPAPRAGMPERVPVSAGDVRRPCVPAEPGYAAGRWDKDSPFAALVRGPYGYFVNTAPESGAAHAELLLAMLGDLEPSVWVEAARSTRARALAAMDAAAARWSRLRLQPGLPLARREEIEEGLRLQRSRIPDARPPSPELEGNRTLLAGRVQAALGVIDRLQELSCRMAVSRAGEVRGVWFHTYARQDWDAVMRKLRDAGLNALFLRVGRGGNVIYPSAILPRDPWAEGPPDELQAAIDAARRYGIAIHAWRVNFHMGTAPPEFYQRMASEDRLVRDPQGRQGKFLNPADPRNQEQEFQVMLELVRRYDIDGIQFDYIRYPDDPHFEWDYGPVSRREFEKATGRPVERWPEDVLSGPRKQEYEDWERENVNRLVRRVYREVKRIKPWVQVSAAVWRNHRRYRAVIKQDWPRWAREGWVDFLVPMDYTPEHDTFAQTVEAQLGVTRGRVPLVAGIGSFLLRSPLDVVLQVEASRAHGADGFVLFDYNDRNIDRKLGALRAGATAEPTWPAYLAPRAHWTLSPSLDLKDQPLILTTGEEVRLELKLEDEPRSKERVRTLRAELRLEEPSGELLMSLGEFQGFGERKMRFAAPAGRFLPVVRGTLILAGGARRPFVARGPVCHGTDRNEVAALLARDEPPVPRGMGRRVGVYMGGLGARGLLEFLAGQSGLVVFPVYRLRADHLAVVDVLVLPQLADVEELGPETAELLRRWVSDGGVLLATHDAVGARWHPRLFPEVGVGIEVADNRRVVVAAEAGALRPGTAFEHASTTHVRIAPASGARVLLREAGADQPAVAVAGTVGRGRVILYGALPGFGPAEMADAEKEFFLALLSQ